MLINSFPQIIPLPLPLPPFGREAEGAGEAEGSGFAGRFITHYQL